MRERTIQDTAWTVAAHIFGTSKSLKTAFKELRLEDFGGELTAAVKEIGFVCEDCNLWSNCEDSLIEGKCIDCSDNYWTIGA